MVVGGNRGHASVWQYARFYCKQYYKIDHRGLSILFSFLIIVAYFLMEIFFYFPIENSQVYQSKRTGRV